MTKTTTNKSSSWLRFGQIFPPYAKYAIFFACGLEVIYHAFVMAINQKFFEMSAKLFPVAFRMFNDTMRRGDVIYEDGTPYNWSSIEYATLNLYQTKLILMWFISTLTILYSMLCVVPQFCEFEEITGENRTWCMKKPILGYIMAPILIVLIGICTILLTWQWLTCQNDADLFYRLFNNALKEEKYLSVIEREFNCITDEDKESIDMDWLESVDSQEHPTEPAPLVRQCNMLVEGAMLNQEWLNILYYTFLFYHFIVFIFFGYFNQENLPLPFTKHKNTDEKNVDIESDVRLI